MSSEFLSFINVNHFKTYVGENKKKKNFFLIFFLFFFFLEIKNYIQFWKEKKYIYINK
jgi:hypothetical protein